MLSWNFLTESLESDYLILDCRSESLFVQSTLNQAYSAAFVKKPFGSGPKSVASLSGYLKHLISLAEKEKKSGILVFDEGMGMYASRMMWLLLSAGYSSVKMLSQKFSDVPSEWIGPGSGVIQAEPAETPLNLSGIVNINYLQQNLTKIQLLDVRTPDEYAGHLPRMVNPEEGSICGRIPGSLNWDWRQLYGPDGVLKSRGEIVSEIRKIGLIQERPTVIYDYNGARSSTTALLLSKCGYRQVQVYLGSWMEWRKTRLPKQNVRTWHS